MNDDYREGPRSNNFWMNMLKDQRWVHFGEKQAEPEEKKEEAVDFEIFENPEGFDVQNRTNTRTEKYGNETQGISPRNSPPVRRSLENTNPHREAYKAANNSSGKEKRSNPKILNNPVDIYYKRRTGKYKIVPSRSSKTNAKKVAGTQTAIQRGPTVPQSLDLDVPEEISVLSTDLPDSLRSSFVPTPRRKKRSRRQNREGMKENKLSSIDEEPTIDNTPSNVQILFEKYSSEDDDDTGRSKISSFNKFFSKTESEDENVLSENSIVDQFVDEEQFRFESLREEISSLTSECIEAAKDNVDYVRKDVKSLLGLKEASIKYNDFLCEELRQGNKSFIDIDSTQQHASKQLVEDGNSDSNSKIIHSSHKISLKQESTTQIGNKQDVTHNSTETTERMEGKKTDAELSTKDVESILSVSRDVPKGLDGNASEVTRYGKKALIDEDSTPQYTKQEVADNFSDHGKILKRNYKTQIDDDDEDEYEYATVVLGFADPLRILGVANKNRANPSRHPNTISQRASKSVARVLSSDGNSKGPKEKLNNSKFASDQLNSPSSILEDLSNAAHPEGVDTEAMTSYEDTAPYDEALSTFLANQKVMNELDSQYPTSRQIEAPKVVTDEEEADTDDAPAEVQDSVIEMTFSDTAGMTMSDTESVWSEEQTRRERSGIPEILYTQTSRREYYCCCLILMLSILVGLAAGFLAGMKITNAIPASRPLDEEPTSEDVFNDILLENALQTIGEDPNSPQTRAYSWLQNDPQFKTYSSFRLLQRFVLAVLYYSLNGEYWTKSENWLSHSSHECDWYSDEYHGAVCNGDEYMNLYLYAANASGTIPPEVSLLRSLVKLDLSYNNLIGSIPSQLSALTGLRELDLYGNSLSGSIPHEIVSVTKNLEIDSDKMISYTSFSDLSNLLFVSLANNSLTGTLPTDLFSNWRWLIYLTLADNRFSGTLPTEFGLLSNAQSLDLSNNGLRGSLPTELGQLTKATHLHFHGNGITGFIPSELGSLKTLEEIWLHGNLLQGSVPTEVCELLETGSLQTLSIDCFYVHCSCGCSCHHAIETKDDDPAL